jgi:hypothetical protein
MSDIFISYAREDRAIAKILANLLELQKWSVWWDREILPGDQFQQIIDKELVKAKCIVVLWSRSSMDSGWVIYEATKGKDRNILAPVLIEDVEIPDVFREINTANLADWTGESSHSEFVKLLEAIKKILRRPLTGLVWKIIVSSLAILITLVLVIMISGRPSDLILTSAPNVDPNNNEVSFKFKQSDPNLCTGKVCFTVSSDLGDTDDQYEEAMIKYLKIEAGDLKYDPSLIFISKDEDYNKIAEIEYCPKEPNEYHILTVTVSCFPVLLKIESKHLENDNVIEWSSKKGMIRNGEGIVHDPYQLKE